MSKPTPEERARKHCDAPYHDHRPGLCSYCEPLGEEIRAAVEAERERCEAEWKQERRDLIEQIDEARKYGDIYDGP